MLIAAQIRFDHREAIDNIADGALDGFERFLHTPLAVDRAVARRCRVGRARGRRTGAQAFEMNEQFGHAALDRSQMAEPRFRGVELFHQLDDAVFEAAERDVVAARELDTLELVVERVNEVIEVG